MAETKKYANQQGISIIEIFQSMLPLTVQNTWSNPELFQLDEKLNPIAVAGCPPDAFAEDGQLWGNPLYDWETIRIPATAGGLSE